MKYYIFLYLCLFSIILSSCDEDRNGVPTGVLYVGVEEDNTLFTKAQTEVSNESLQVIILKGEEDTLKVYNDYLAEVKGQRMVLPVGKYTVTIRSNGVDSVGWETPFYQGQEEVEVKQGEITNAKIVCNIANTKVSVVYGESVQQHFIDYQTVVSNSSDSLIFTRDEYRSGFFTPEKLTVKLNLVNNDGNRFTMKRVYSDIQPQYHYIFKFTLADDGEDSEASADFDVTVDKDSQEIEYNIFIKEEDELFGKGIPKLTLDGEFKDNILTLKKEEDAVIPKALLKLSVPNGIQSVHLKTFSWQFEGSLFDQTNWPVNFPVIDLSKNEQIIDFSSLIEFLQPEGTKTSMHKFVLSVSDNLYQEEEITFSFEIKADVDVSADEPIVWAKFATLKGNSIDLDNLSFEFRKKGEIESEKITNVSVDVATGNFTALKIGMEANTDYQYRAISGENSSDWCDFTTKDTPSVVNLNFDSWCTYTDKKSEMPNANNESIIWDSGNRGTNTDPFATHNPTSKEETFCAVAGSGKNAVRMQADVVFSNFAAGNIYTGNFVKAVLNPTGAQLNFGIPYKGKPTKLMGYYNYTPGSIDNGNKNDMNGKTDIAQIYLALFKWSKAFAVNTATSTFVNLDPKTNPDLIALGMFETSEVSPKDEYQKLNIDIKYYRDDEPTYILIVASASKYGDYFTGSTKSILYIDEFELGFDYNENSFK
ncbi:MAG: PCMD domain-containing protein [Parabacteroides gordonii]|uniref:PCMD domain-containing protein n=1 Tax=Parabacteroides gordonii TaxID=574930 RepID=UPI003A856721